MRTCSDHLYLAAFAAAGLLLAACSCPAPARATTPVGPATPVDSTTTEVAPTDPAPPADTADPAGPTPGPLPAQGMTCTEAQGCADGLACVGYYGIAGERGPRFHSCELRCKGEGASACPAGQTCTNIADGPGPVCRPIPTGEPEARLAAPGGAS